MTTINKENTWKIIQKFLTSNNNTELVKHQLESYDLFMDKYIPDIIKEYNNIRVPKQDKDENMIYKINFNNPSYSIPMTTDKNGKINVNYPKNVRDNNSTYNVSLLVDIDIEVEITNTKDNTNKIWHKCFERQDIGEIPLMIGSKYCLTNMKNYKENTDMCKHDRGGYFIINGNEKVIISQERMADNKPFFFNEDNKNYSCEIRSNTDMTKMAHVFKLKYNKQKGIRVSFNNLTADIPLFVLFDYLGATNDQMIYNYIVGSDTDADYFNLLKESLREKQRILEDIDSETFIKKHMKNKTIPVDILVKEKVLNHLFNEDVSIEKNCNTKMYYIGIMVKKLLDVILGREQVTDRDNFKNKRVETPGILLSQLFRKLYKNVIKSFKNTIVKEHYNSFELQINKIIKNTIITNGLKYSLSTGSWNSKVGAENKKVGVAQVLNRLTFTGTISHLRRLNAPTSKSGKLIEPRKLHNSQYGMVCPCETPEGQMVGLVKNLSLNTNITNYSNDKIIYHYITSMDNVTNICDFEDNIDNDITSIYINGNLVGVTKEGQEVVDYIRNLRRQKKINYTVSITFKYDTNEILVYTKEGRCIRPLFVVGKNNKLNISKKLITRLKRNKLEWTDMIDENVVEYIDIEEIGNVMVAENQEKLNNKNIKYNYCEIHPSLILGTSASLIPLLNHNQSPRNAYQSSMCKQAIGINSTKSTTRMDTISHVLHYPQRPIVYTRSSEILGFNEMPAGDNLIVAIATHTGFNMEDSMIINRASIERGLFHSTFYRTYIAEEKKNMSALAEEKFGIPDAEKCIGIRTGDYNLLDTNGLVKENTQVKGEDIIIGKMTPIIGKNSSSKKDIKYKDTSTQLRYNEEGIVDKVQMTHTADGYQLAKVKIRTIKIPEIADKAASRHGQKGTIGLIIDEEDMPFTEDGVIPDIIINTHALPSRMTIAQLIECALSKVGATKGKFMDGTPFEDLSHQVIAEELEKIGFESTGYETMYNGETGEKMKTKIFIGPTYYQRLKHMVSEKIHARSRGPVQMLTHQPTEGRSRDGGLRFGEMEGNGMVSHGMAYFFKEKTFENSDKFNAVVCKKCGNITPYNPEEDIVNCNVCETNTEFSQINIPYASKLLFTETTTMGIMPKFY